MSDEVKRLKEELEIVKAVSVAESRACARLRVERNRYRAALHTILIEEEASIRPGGSLSASGRIAKEALADKL